MSKTDFSLGTDPPGDKLVKSRSLTTPNLLYLDLNLPRDSGRPLRLLSFRLVSVTFRQGDRDLPLQEELREGLWFW